MPSNFTTPYDYELKEVIVSGERFISDIDITTIVGQLDIYEDINKPFLVGKIAISNDNAGIIPQINFIGTEKINIKLSLPSIEGLTPVVINKNFIITQLEKDVKINDDASVVVLEMIEDSGYLNYLENVNKVYEGTGTQIISNCLADFIGKGLELVNDDGSSMSTLPFRIIVPNWHPFEVVSWVKSLMVKESGFPYYFYSTIHSDNIRQNNLLTMLQSPAVNAKAFVYSTSAASQTSGGTVDNGAYVINNLNVNKGLSVLNKIREGNVGSTSINVNMSKNSSTRQVEKFDIYNMFADIKNLGGIKPNQSHIKYDGRATVKTASGDNKKLHKYNSRHISELEVSQIYDDIHNSTDVVPLENKLNAKAISSWMESGKITIRVPGRNFLATSSRDAIQLGDNIKVKVFSSANTEDQPEPVLDKAQSGDYIIQTIRHMFIQHAQKYQVVAECTKLTDVQNGNGRMI
jgi:hypothetical protein